MPWYSHCISSTGKILGIEGNYIIAEVVFKDGQDHHQDQGEEESDSVLDKLYGPPRLVSTYRAFWNTVFLAIS